MQETATAEALITYGELARRIKALPYAPNSRALTDLLCKISQAENVAERGMLSVVVVRKDRGLPGEGFFDLARKLGFSIEDQRDFWERERAKVYEVWTE